MGKNQNHSHYCTIAKRELLIGQYSDENTVKPVYKEHSGEHENVPFMYWLKLYALFIDRENEALICLEVNKGNNKITELRTIFQRERQNS